MQQSSVHSYQFSWFDWFCLWYPPGWLILFNRHWQHYQPNPDGWNWLEYGLFLIPGGFYLALLMRWLRLGCRLPRASDTQFNPHYQQAFRDEVLTPILKYYFRAELHQVENLPQTEPLIVAMNHAGMCFPWDFIGLAYLLSQARGWVVKPLAGVSLFEHPWVLWWLPPGWSQVLGGIPSQAKDFETAVAQKNTVLYAPEGLRGPGKGFFKRYQLETFHSSFIELSDRYGIPILPVACIGNEFLHPLTINLKKLAKRFYLPFLPISPLMPIFILFPSMGVWAMRSRLQYHIQPLYQPGTEAELVQIDKTSSGEMRSALLRPASLTRSLAYREAQQLREKLQSTITQLLSKRGHLG
jgi:1-acyl-sn-glycerol-3-phosphate acyltransferase